MKKETIKFILKIILYIITAIAGYFGVSSFVGCTVQREITTTGHGIGIFHYSDTFQVKHGNKVNVKVN